jgi:hypothetical protein
MLPTPIGVSDALLSARAPPDSASCACFSSRHSCVAASSVFPYKGNSRERARPRGWLISVSQSIRAESEGPVRSHVKLRYVLTCFLCFMFDPRNTNRVTDGCRPAHTRGQRTPTTSGRDSQGGVSINGADNLSRALTYHGHRRNADTAVHRRGVVQHSVLHY